MEDLIRKTDNLINAARASCIPDTICSDPTENLPNIKTTKFIPHKCLFNNQAQDNKPGAYSQLPPYGMCYYRYKFGAGDCKCTLRSQWPKNI